MIVVGAEGSGTTLLWDCVRRHPQLAQMKALNYPTGSGPLPAEDVVLHLSLPTLRPMRWFGASAAPNGVRVIVVKRSPLHTVFSAYRRFYRAPRPAWRSYFRAVALEASWVAHHQPLCVSYEDLVHNTGAVLRRVYEFLGVDAAFSPPIEITDQNDERWLGDSRFAAFMRRAFGAGRLHFSSPDRDTAVETLDLRVHGVRVSVEDASGAGIAAAVREALPPDLEAPGDATPVAHYAVECESGRDGSIVYRVAADGDVLLRTRRKERAVNWLRGRIDQTIAESSRTSLFVHAGVVGWRGRAIVIPGRTMSGKSSLVAELVRRGATYYSDEYAVFDAEGRVLPYARRPILRDADAGADLDRAAAAPLPLGLIVSTSYRAGSAWRPRELRGVLAVAPIIDNTVLARAEARSLLALAARIAPRAVTLQGPRPDAAEVAPRLLAHLDDLLADGADRELRSGPAALVERAQAALETAASSRPEQVLPPRYVRIDSFLGEQEHARLLAYARRRAPDFAASSVIDPDGSSKVDDQFRRSATLYDLDEVWALFEGRLRRLLPHVRRELEIPWFPLGLIERQMSAHRQGDFFGRHSDDGGPAVADRRLTCVFYFHGEPKRFSGGDLKLYERHVRGGRIEAGPGHVVVEPENDSAVFFTSDTPHEVCAVSQASEDFADSRFSITIWFRSGSLPGCLDVPTDAGASDASRGGASP